MTRDVTVHVELAVACGHLGCNWSRPVDGSKPGQDAMAVHAAYLDHLDTHYPDNADCEAVERSAPVCECGLLDAECNGLDLADPSISKLHNHARELARQLQAAPYAVHDAEVVQALEHPVFTCPKCLAVSHHPEDVRQGYCGRCHDFTGIYAGDTPTRLAAEQARIDRFMAGGE